MDGGGTRSVSSIYSVTVYSFGAESSSSPTASDRPSSHPETEPDTRKGVSLSVGSLGFVGLSGKEEWGGVLWGGSIAEPSRCTRNVLDLVESRGGFLPRTRGDLRVSPSLLRCPSLEFFVFLTFGYPSLHSLRGIDGTQSGGRFLGRRLVEAG